MCKKLYDFVDWLSYGPKNQTWELDENLTNAKEIIVETHHRYPNTPNATLHNVNCGTPRQMNEIMLWAYTKTLKAWKEPK